MTVYWSALELLAALERYGQAMSTDESAPNPGSSEAIALGCICPVLDNGHGRGYWGGMRDEDGELLFSIVIGCPLHAPASRPTLAGDGA